MAKQIPLSPIINRIGIGTIGNVIKRLLKEI